MTELQKADDVYQAYLKQRIVNNPFQDAVVGFLYLILRQLITNAASQGKKSK